MNKLLIFFVFLFVCSCTKEIPFNTESFAPELVVNSLFTPDSVFAVYIHQTSPIDVQGWKAIVDAKVEIKKQGDPTRIPLSYLSNGRYENPDLSPQIGAVYELFVDAGTFGSAYAKDSVPNLPVVYKSEFSRGTTVDEYGDEHIDMDIGFINNLSKDLFWEMILVSDYNKQDEGSRIGVFFSPFLPDPIILAEGYLDFEPKSFIFSNQHIETERYLLKMKMNPYSYSLRSPSPTPFPGSSGRESLIFRSISQSYYDYQKAWIQHYYHQPNGARINDPLRLLFSGEPTRLYSNVEGAHGVFAAYTSLFRQMQEK